MSAKGEGRTDGSAHCLVHSRLDQITTQWSAVSDPSHFVLRYAPAIRRYVQSMVHNADETDEVLQDFLVRVLQHGFRRASPDRGRFRDYLRTAVRNAVRSHLAKRRPSTLSTDKAPEPAARESDGPQDEWDNHWRATLIDRTWQALERHERQHPGNVYYTVLQAAAAHPDMTSAQLAARVSARTSTQMRAPAFRKQLSRARRKFAELLLIEIAETLDQPSDEQVESELVELGLLAYVRDLMPGAGRRQGR